MPTDVYASEAALRLDSQLCFKVYALNHLIGRAYRPLLDQLGLTYPQYIALLALWETSPLSVGELGRRLRLDSGTLTPLLKRMEAAGLVSRRRAIDDERRVQVALTPEGEALKLKAADIPGELACRIPDAAFRDFEEFHRLSERLQRLIYSMAGAVEALPVPSKEKVK
jgi:MarR family transcriptional regulator, organic hydroperoxide resistance regulator